MDGRGGAALVGRQAELAQLESTLDAARAGAGGAVLLVGEAGIGKSRLAGELAARARDAGFDVLLGRSIDLVGTELPYQPFVQALRPLGNLGPVDTQAASKLQVFDEALSLLDDRAAAMPVLLVLEDLHWADASTLDLVVFVSHNLEHRPILLLGTYRADEPASAERMRRLTDGVRRSGSALVLDIEPLADEELEVLIATRANKPLPARLTAAIISRCEGNPFFAEELVSAADDLGGELPPGLRDLLLQRAARLDPSTQSLLRLAAAAGRDVGYPLLCASAQLPERDVRDSLQQAIEHGVLVADQQAGRFRFRHALLAEAIYATILPGEREELHARLAEELARSGAADPAELAPHWAAAGRKNEALIASIEAARQAEAVFGLAEAHAHLERALELWDAVPEAVEFSGLDLAHVCAWASRLASQVGAAPRAVELARRAIELVGTDDLPRSAVFHVYLGEYLYEIGENEAALGILEKAVELAPVEPPSSERAYVLASLAGGLMVARRHAESLPVGEEALLLSRAVGAGEAEVRALTLLGGDHAYLGRAEEGLAYFRQALELAEQIGDYWGLERVYINLTDALTMLGRPRESIRTGQKGLEEMRRYGVESSLIVSNLTEALLTTGDWDEADRLSAVALRRQAGSFPYALLIVRALVETERGDFDAAREHFDAATVTLRKDREHGLYDGWLADLALWEHRWLDADTAIQQGLVEARSREAALIRIQICAKGLRTQAELAALARARRDDEAARNWLVRAEELIAVARSAAAEVSTVTPIASGWLSLAEAEYERTRGTAHPERWSTAAAAWDRLESPPRAAYCRWRQAEALVAAGASRTEAGVPLRAAYAVATPIGARPFVRELELLARRAGLDLAPPSTYPHHGGNELEESLGLTPREAEVLRLVARGYTNREIGEMLVISVKTASVHVSHILRKLGAPNRREAAAIVHRLDLPG
jgi:DNA-binding CsgD family transcriptional regulator/tetratricopeptide (TPR) repeat protein